MLVMNSDCRPAVKLDVEMRWRVAYPCARAAVVRRIGISTAEYY